VTGPITLTRSVPAELGHTTDPTALVPGDPAAARSGADTLGRIGGLLTTTGDRLGRLTIAGWSGAAADRFHEVFHPQPGRWRQAGEALGAAAAALRDHAGTLAWAQAQAAEAIALYEQGLAETRQARTEHAAAVRAAARTAAVGSGAPTQLPFHDPGEDTRQQARDLLSRTRAQLVEAGDRAHGIVTDSADQAPLQPRWWQRAWKAAGEYRAGVHDSVADLAAFAWDTSTVRMFVDPAGYADTLATLAHGARYAVHHPVEFARTVIDWDTWQANPARALGRLAPDLALVVATGGGAAAVRGTRLVKTLDAVDTTTPGPTPAGPGPVSGPGNGGPGRPHTDFGPLGRSGTGEAAAADQPASIDESPRRTDPWEDHPDAYDPTQWGDYWWDLPRLDDPADASPRPAPEPTQDADRGADAGRTTESAADRLDPAGRTVDAAPSPHTERDSIGPSHGSDREIDDAARQQLDELRRDHPAFAHLTDDQLLGLVRAARQHL
jgi:hypothetical protein